MSQTPSTRRQLRERDQPHSGSSSAVSSSSSSSGAGVGGGSSSPGVGRRGESKAAGKMRTRLSTGTLVMNGTSTRKEKDTRTTPSDPSAVQASTSQRNTPTGSKRQASSSEITMTAPPKRRKLLKNDGSECDLYCWLCHRDNCSVTCPLCPRSYHPKCLMMVSVPSDWACGECEKIMEAGCMDTRSRAMKQITTDTLSLLLRYALDRMRQPGSEVFQKPANTADLPYYSDIVINPMDFSTLEKNIKKKEYGSTEEFLADAKWMLHNCIIYNGVHHKLTTVARHVLKSCKHEMAEVEVCPQCYKHSCLSGEANWFIQPCDPPHPLVWAKLKGYPYWPAKAMEEVGGGVDVRFFGAHDKSVIMTSQVYMLSKDPPTSMAKKKGGFMTAMVELKQHMEVIREKYGSCDFAANRTPYDQTQVTVNPKVTAVSVTAPKRFKLAAQGRIAARKETEKLSATSKTASAVKSKYTFLFSKKSSSSSSTSSSSTATIPTTTTTTSTATSTTTSPVSNKRKSGRPRVTPRLSESSPETAEKAIQKALSDCGRTSASKSLFINPTVKVTDIIQLKMQQQREMEEKEGAGKWEEDDEDTSSGSDVVMNEEMEEEKGDGPSSGSGADWVGEEKLSKDGTADESSEGKCAVTSDSSDENSKGKCPVTRDSSVEQGSNSSVAASKTADADAVGENSEEKQAEKVGAVSRTASQTTSKDQAVQDREADGRSREGVQGASEKNTATKNSPEKLENGKERPQGETTPDDSLTKKSDERRQPSTEGESCASEKDKAGKAAGTGTSVLDESKNVQPVSQRAATPATSREESANEKTADNSSSVEQRRGSLKSCAVSAAATSEKTVAKNSSAAKQMTLSGRPTSPSPTSSPDPAVTEVSPKSGEEYRESLMKTIEACKGQLGISSVEEVEGPMEASDDEEDSQLSKDDQGSQESATEVTAESQVSSDSQDSRTSLEMEVDSMPSSTGHADLKSDSETVSEKKTKSDKETHNVLATSGSRSDSEPLVVRKPVSEADGGSVSSQTPSSSEEEKSQESGQGSGGVRVSPRAEDPVSDVHQAGAADREAKTSAHLESGQVQTVPAGTPPQGSEEGSAGLPGSSSDGTATASPPSPHSPSATRPAAKRSRMEGVSPERKRAKAASLLEKAAEGIFKLMAQSGKHKASAADRQTAAVTQPPPPRPSLLKTAAVTQPPPPLRFLLKTAAVTQSPPPLPSLLKTAAVTQPPPPLPSLLKTAAVTQPPPPLPSLLKTAAVTQPPPPLPSLLKTAAVTEAPPPLPSLLKTAAVTQPPPPLPSLLRTEVSRPVPGVAVGAAPQPSQGEGVPASSALPSPSVSTPSGQKSQTSSSGASSGGSQVNPITIIDDDEPSLLMEVETEGERDRRLVIDLEDEGPGMNENQAVHSKSTFCTQQRGTPPAPGDSQPRKVQRRVTNKSKAQSPDSLSPSASPSSSPSFSEPCGKSTLSEPCGKSTLSESCGKSTLSESCGKSTLSESCGKSTLSEACGKSTLSESCGKSTLSEACGKSTLSEPCGKSTLSESCGKSTLSEPCGKSALSEECGMVISEVRSLSGTLHDWKEDRSKKATSSPPAPPVVRSQPAEVADLPLEPTQPQLQQNFRMPPTPPVEASQATTTGSPSTARPPSSSVSASSVADRTDNSPLVSQGDAERPPQDCRPAEQCPAQILTPAATLTPAAVSLVNKYSQQVVGNMQLQLAEMSKELLKSAFQERDNLIDQRLKEEKEQLQWTLTEVQHNHKTTIAEMKACWEAEMSKALQDMSTRMTREREEAVTETKKKQWCADCWKEALYYCCWNTSYCSYSCQERHWATHQHLCRQLLDSAPTPTPTPTPSPSTGPTPTSTFLPSASVAAAAAGLVSMRTGNDKDAANAGASGQTQKFSIQHPRPATVNVVQGEDIWRNCLGQNIQFLSPQAMSQALRMPVGSSPQAIQQQLQYLRSLTPSTGPATFHTSPQVQLVGQRPVLNMVLPGIFPIVRHAQPSTTTTSQNVVLQPNTQHYQ